MTILEKIRAEIVDTFLWEGQTEEELNSSVQKCLEIIDKYAEQEPKWIPVTYGNCMVCGKELTDNPFICEECEKGEPND